MNKNEDLYALQLKRKRDLFLSFFSEFTKDLDYFSSPISNFRTRAELGVHVNDSINFTMVKNNKKVTFSRYRKGNLYYKTECGFEFPVPISDTGDGEFLSEDKALTYMRWIRKHIKESNQSMQT